MIFLMPNQVRVKNWRNLPKIWLPAVQIWQPFCVPVSLHVSLLSVEKCLLDLHVCLPNFVSSHLEESDALQLHLILQQILASSSFSFYPVNANTLIHKWEPNLKITFFLKTKIFVKTSLLLANKHNFFFLFVVLKKKNQARKNIPLKNFD